MPNPFFEHPILNSPYACPKRHWELDAQGQPTEQIIETRRRADFITPIPKPKKQKGAFTQLTTVYDEGKGLSTQEQQYDADTFTDGLARLTGDEQKAVKTTAFDLQLNPANPGMKFHCFTSPARAPAITCW
jgi:hypothetical protein